MSDAATDPDDRVVELPPEGPSTLGLWFVMLAGPIIWVTHFGIVYLAAEASCAAAKTPAMTFLDPDALVVTVVVATALAAAADVAAGFHAWRLSRRGLDDRAQLAFAGLLLAAGSLAAVLAVGLPALALEPC